MAVTNPVSQRQSGRSNGGDVPPFERGPAPSHADEAGIIARCVAGGRKAYGVLVDRYKQLVHDLVHRMVGDAPQAEDIAQDAFVKAFVSIRQFRGDARFSTWVCRIAINRCKDVLRRQAREPRAPAALYDVDDPTAEIPDGGETPALALERHEQEDLLRRTLARLPAKYREAVVLRHLEGMDFDEIGRVLGIPAGAAKVRTFRGREMLRKLIESDGVRRDAI